VGFPRSRTRSGTPSAPFGAIANRPPIDGPARSDCEHLLTAPRQNRDALTSVARDDVVLLGLKPPIVALLTQKDALERVATPVKICSFGVGSAVPVIGSYWETKYCPMKFPGPGRRRPPGRVSKRRLRNHQ